MVGTLTSISYSKESLSIQGLCTRYRSRSPRNRWDRSVAQPAEYFCRGARVIGTFPGKHWAVRCRARALRPLYHHFCLGWTPEYEEDTNTSMIDRCPLLSEFRPIISCRLLISCYFPFHLFSWFGTERRVTG